MPLNFWKRDRPIHMDHLTYVINMPSSEDRRINMRRQLNGLGWKFSLTDGVLVPLNADLTAFGYSAFQSKLAKGRELARGEIGCYLAHCNVFIQFLKSDRKYCVVLEDDISLAAEFQHLVNVSIPYLTSYEIIKFESNVASKDFLALHEAVGRYRLGVFRSGSYGTGAYIISRHGAKKFLKYYGRPKVPIDDALNFLNHAAWSPSPVVQDKQFESVIGAGLSAYPPKTRGLMRLIYRLGKRHRIFGKW